MKIPIDKFAIIVNQADNIAVVKREATSGLLIELADHRIVELKNSVSTGDRFAMRDIPADSFVLQFGQPIGTSLGIIQGERIDGNNMTDSVPVIRDLRENLNTQAPDYIPVDRRGTFMGFLRPDGRAGTRNFVLIVPTSMCASHEAQQISFRAEYELFNQMKYPNVDGIVAIPHNKGCGCQDGSTIDVMLRTLSNYADHPNVGGVILMDLGCEKTNMVELERYLLKRELSFRKPVAKIGIQEVGGTRAAIEEGLSEVERMLPAVNRDPRVQVPVSELVLGVKCGGSDAFSGISANPVVGIASDLLVRSGGTVLMTEVPEFCGAEHLLANRAKDYETGLAVYRMVDWYKEYASKFGAVLDQNPSPGNKAGGLLNITIKSLGAIAKAGTTRVEAVLEYAERVENRGVNLMQGPGYDQESTPGLVAAGATIVLFTTGRGTTIGNAIAPVVKVASNTEIFQRMSSDLDLSAGAVIDGTETLTEAGQRVFEELCRVASGEIQAKAELHKHREFQLWAEQTVSL